MENPREGDSRVGSRMMRHCFWRACVAVSQSLRGGIERTLFTVNYVLYEQPPISSRHDMRAMTLVSLFLAGVGRRFVWMLARTASITALARAVPPIGHTATHGQRRGWIPLLCLVIEATCMRSGVQISCISASGQWTNQRRKDVSPCLPTRWRGMPTVTDLGTPQDVVQHPLHASMGRA